MTETDLQVRLQVAKQACYIGGDELKRFYRGVQNQEYILDRQSLLLEADTRARRSMSAFLGQVYSKEPISGKGVGPIPNAKNFWVIDALNGEQNYASGGVSYSTTLAWVQNGEVTLGVIFDPITNTMYSATKGVGAFIDTKKIDIKRIAKLKEAHAIAYLGENGEGLESAKKLAPQVTHLTAPESPALGLALTATGKVDCFVGRDLEPWHWLAGKLFVEEAGGTTSDFSGSPLKFDSKEIVATNGPIHNETLKALA